MRRSLFLTFASCVLAAATAAAAIAPGPYYARGDFYSAPGSPGSSGGLWGYVPELQLWDDGLHGDGAANDGVYGVDVVCNTSPGYHEFKIANADWTFNEPYVAAAALINGRLYTSFYGETVHFRLDTHPQLNGWAPDVAVANDHAYPAGTQLELMGSAPELGLWNTGQALDHDGSIWSRTFTIETPGSYEYKFRVAGTWAYANFGLNYNNNYGANGGFVVTQPFESITIQFDESTGRIRAVDSSTPARGRSWGAIKNTYR
jgi:hypothetical protein